MGDLKGDFNQIFVALTHLHFCFPPKLRFANLDCLGLILPIISFSVLSIFLTMPIELAVGFLIVFAFMFVFL